jgi:hypothetical protein
LGFRKGFLGRDLKETPRKLGKKPQKEPQGYPERAPKGTKGGPEKEKLAIVYPFGHPMSYLTKI